MRIRPVAVSVALVLALLAGCGLFTKSAATVNGSVISEGELDRELTWMRSVPSYEEAIIRGAQLEAAARSRLNSEIVALNLNRLIVFRLVDQEIARRGLSVTEADRRQALTDTVDQVTSLLGDPANAVEVFNSLPRDFRVALVERQAESTVLQHSLPASQPTEEQLRSFYVANRELFEEVCARYVLSATEAESRLALGRIRNGEDFAKVARELSTDPFAKDTGGDVGCFLRGGDVEQVFSDTAFESRLGEVAGPVVSSVGWYLVEVYDRKGDSFEDVRAEVAERFSQSGPAVEFQSLIQGLLVAARVEINPRFGRWDADQRKVVPAL